MSQNRYHRQQHPVLPSHPFAMAPIAHRIWDAKYRLRNGADVVDRDVSDTWGRVAAAASAVEAGGKLRRAHWAAQFEAAMADFGFLPGGRIIAGAGTGRAVTLFNCFVMGTVPDDLTGIFDGVREAALTMQAGGGIGVDFSTLRPRGAKVHSIGADASGPVSFMDVWDAMCRTIMSAGARRGAMMATLRCDHPDIELFIAAKGEAKRLRNFNLSVLVTDAFVTAVRADQPWDLVFGGRVYQTVQARALWQQVMRATYDQAEPGVVFIDRINAANNLGYCETIAATNPCGEQPLPAYGACLLGSINLTQFVDQPFEAGADVDLVRLADRVAVAVRFLDNIIDISNYPLRQQRAEARAKRRIGLGITGLADALIMCGAIYGATDAATRAGRWMAAVQRAAYLASADLAAEKGSFPAFDADQFLARPHVQSLDEDVRAKIAAQGLRNGCLTSIAPTGTISLLAGNVSSGIEPVFDFKYRRRVLEADGQSREEVVEDYAHRLHAMKFGADTPRGPAFVTAASLTPEAHLVMQAAVQRHVDSSISKTINCPADMPFAAFEGIYMRAYDLGLKGCTTFRPNAITGSILEPLVTPTGVAEPGIRFGATPASPGRVCSQCHDAQLVKQEGCWMCPICGYSRCG
jgi:ribonucleoside-diphosphate reductase alpha chain